MTKLRKMAIIGVAVLTVGVMSLTAFAASGNGTPAEIVAGLTGKTVESVTAERAETGKTYGTIAKEADKLDEFKAEMLELKKAQLSDMVAAGTITQEKADEILSVIEQNQAACDGTGIGKAGGKMGAGFGLMNGGRGNGQGRMGRGMGFGGACRAQ